MANLGFPSLVELTMPFIRNVLFVCFGFILYMHVPVGMAQDFIPGNSYLDANGYVEYLPGNIPVILSVPHGGYLDPDSIPDRECDGCVYARDSYTQELAQEIREEFYAETGCYPYVIINLLHRKKFDANRSIETAADGNVYVEASWDAYHAFIDSAKSRIVSDYGRGLFLDIHGHAHDIERIELGYLFTKSELQLTAAELNTEALIDETSIKQLVVDNYADLECAELLRGSQSLGTLLHEQGFPSVPSTTIPAPLDEEPYFNGGYNTVEHGSKNGGMIDAIQLEFNSDVRWNVELRQQLADSLVISITEYIETHYLPMFSSYYCLLPELGTLELQQNKFEIHPNPAHTYILLSNTEKGWIRVFNLSGSQVLSNEWRGHPIDVRSIEHGVYLLVFENAEGERFYNKFIKQ